VKGKFDNLIQAYLKVLHATQKSVNSESTDSGNEKRAESESKDWLDSFVRNQAPITGKDLCQLRHHGEIQALRDSGKAKGRAAETLYWECLEESERRSFNDEAAAMKMYVFAVFVLSVLLTRVSNGFNVIHSIYTALNKIAGCGRVAGGLTIYVKTAFRNGPQLEVSSFQCGEHSDGRQPTFEEYAARESVDLHEKWKQYTSSVLAGSLHGPSHDSQVTDVSY
jgi:hypothetical protein